MTTMQVGQVVNVRYLAYAAGVATTATVALAVTDPAGSSSAPSVVFTSPNIYDASFTLASAGVWYWQWNVSGTVTDVETGSVFATSPGPVTYATLAELKAYLGIADTTQDALLQDSLESGSRGVEHHCSRRFWPDVAASARIYEPRDSCVVMVDDFWTSTGLIVKTDTAGDGTYATTLASSDYVLEPYNGVNDGEPGWPYFRIRSVNHSFANYGRRPFVQVTAKWGWPAVPAPIKQAAVYMAEEAFKMKGSPFGVASYDQFGPIRMRTSNKVLDMLAPYRAHPVLVA